MAKSLCTSFVDPEEILSLLACRLVTFYKCLVVRPIGISVVLRRIVAKTALFTIIGEYRSRVLTKLSSGGVVPPFAWLAPLFQL